MVDSTVGHVPWSAPTPPPVLQASAATGLSAGVSATSAALLEGEIKPGFAAFIAEVVEEARLQEELRACKSRLEAAIGQEFTFAETEDFLAANSQSSLARQIVSNLQPDISFSEARGFLENPEIHTELGLAIAKRLGNEIPLAEMCGFLENADIDHRIREAVADLVAQMPLEQAIRIVSDPLMSAEIRQRILARTTGMDFAEAEKLLRDPRTANDVRARVVNMLSEVTWWAAEGILRTIGATSSKGTQDIAIDLAGRLVPVALTESVENFLTDPATHPYVRSVVASCLKPCTFAKAEGLLWDARIDDDIRKIIVGQLLPVEFAEVEEFLRDESIPDDIKRALIRTKLIQVPFAQAENYLRDAEGKKEWFTVTVPNGPTDLIHSRLSRPNDWPIDKLKYEVAQRIVRPSEQEVDAFLADIEVHETIRIIVRSVRDNSYKPEFRGIPRT